MTEDELILSLCKEKTLVKGGSDEEVIQQFRTLYQSHSELVTKAAQGEKRLEAIEMGCGLKVLPQHSSGKMETNEKGEWSPYWYLTAVRLGANETCLG